MANRKSIRRTRQSDRARGMNHRRTRHGNATSQRPPGSKRPVQSSRSDAQRQLAWLALKLKAVYGTALAVELALRKQNAEQDIDLVECLRAGVCDVIAEQDHVVRSLLAEHDSALPELMP